MVVYPNPAAELIYIRVPEPVKELFIYDMRGRMVKSVMNSRTQIDISDFTNGLYCLRVIGNKQTWTAKFIKQ